MAYIRIDAETETGERVDVLVDSAAPPGFGEWFEDEGRRLRRLVSVPQRPRVKRYSFVGYQFPSKRDALKQGRVLAKHYTDKGIPAFDSRREMEEYAAKVNDSPAEGYNLEWDPDGGLSDGDDE